MMRALALPLCLIAGPALAEPLIAIDAVDTSEPLRMFVHDEVLWREIGPDIFAPADKVAYSPDEEPAAYGPSSCARETGLPCQTARV